MNEEQLRVEAIKAALCLEHYGTSKTLLENATAIYNFLKENK